LGIAAAVIAVAALGVAAALALTGGDDEPRDGASTATSEAAGETGARGETPPAGTQPAPKRPASAASTGRAASWRRPGSDR
jgi:hypothetical protein